MKKALITASIIFAATGCTMGVSLAGQAVPTTPAYQNSQSTTPAYEDAVSTTPAEHIVCVLFGLCNN